MARTAGEDRTGVLNPPALDRLRAEIELFSPRTRERGRSYATRGRVTAVCVDEHGIAADVLGSDLYDVRWELVEGGWAATCSCPVGIDCKHAYAAALVLLDTHAAPLDREPTPTNRQEAASPWPLPHEPYAVTTNAPRVRTRARVDAETVDLLRSADTHWDRHSALIRLLRGAPHADLAYLPALHEALGDADAELRCWRVAALVTEHAQGWLPPALEAYRSRPDLAQEFEERGRQALVGAVLGWVEERRATSARRLRVVFGLVRDASGTARITAEVRLTTSRLADAPRTFTQLLQLRAEGQRGGTALPPEAAALIELLAGPPSYGLTHESFTTLLLSEATLHVLLLQSGHPETAALFSWGDTLHTELAARGGVAAGGPLRFRLDAARLVPTCREQAGDAWLDLAAVWPDGHERALDRVVRLGGSYAPSGPQPTLVLADGEFSVVTEQPPLELVERIERAHGVRLTPRDRGPVLALLGTRFPHLAAALAPHVRYHRVTPAVTLDLRDDDWLQVRAFAPDGDVPWNPSAAATADRLVFEYTPGEGWVRGVANGPSDRPPDLQHAPFDRLVDGPDPGAATVTVSGVPDTAEAGGIGADAPATGTRELPAAEPTEPWLELPDPGATEPVVAWLSALPATSGTRKGPGSHEPTHHDRTIGWWMLLSRRGITALAEAWERRPPNVAFFGTERVRRLLQRADRVVPRLRVAASGIDWLAVTADWEVEGLELGDEDLAALRAATTPFVRLRAGWVRKDVATAHDAVTGTLAELGIELGAGAQRLSLFQLAGARAETLAALGELGADAETLRAVAGLRRKIAAFRGLARVALPRGLKARLRPYQRYGLDFLAYTAALGLGAVLADDMGLGKTVQALAWLEHLRQHEPDAGPSLVVCPASVLHNWAREAARFVPRLGVLVLGSGATRHVLRQQIGSHDLAITTYALLRRDLEAWRTLELRAVILDEAQTIKNPDAVVSRAAGALRARHRLALTGTPLENRALDLWSIVEFVNPGYLGSRAEFSRRYDRLDAPPHARTLLAAKLRPILLRRMKREVALDLPERIEERRDCTMTRGQRQLYLAELRRSRSIVERLSEEPDGIKRNKIVILAALTRLRQICCHPALVGGRVGIGSGKFEAFSELLEPLLAEGHKVLLFSQFVECLKLLRTDLARRDVPYHFLVGQTVKREQVVRAFADDPRPGVFLISLRAGGLGLNLTSASHVVLFDPWWNPAVEAQAIDRTHRIGQDRTVIAFRLLTQGTIEEKIFELQQQKAALARDVLGENGFARSLTRDDLGYLLAEGC